MRVRLNLATKPLESHRRFLAGSGVAAFAAIAILAALSWHVHAVRKANADAIARTAKARKDLEEYKAQRAELESFFGRKENASLHDRADFLNHIIDARSFNWTQMFMDLERILPGGVHVISVEPKQSAGHAELKLTVGAGSQEAKLKLLHALEQSKQFSEVQVQRDSPPNTTGNTTGDQRIIQLTTVYFSGT
jgi:type IV pilus assembly protein PilN